MARGRFITFEGGEGTGKSTQIVRLAEALKGRGLAVLCTREPGGSPGAEDIRRLLVEGEAGRWDATTEALLNFAARRDHLVRTIWPAIGQGTWVLCDRFIDSTIAYQGHGHGMDLGAIAALAGMVAGDFHPDLTLILDLPVEEGLRRAALRNAGEDRFERMDQAFHHRLRDGYLAIARAEPDRCVVIPADGDIAAVHARIVDAVKARLG